jgi:hypothetical protein
MKSKKQAVAINYFEMGMIPLTVGMATNEKDFYKEMQRLRVPYSNGFVSPGASASVKFFDQGGKSMAIICIDRKSHKKTSWRHVVSVLTHEAVHVWQEAKRVMGVELIDDEIEAYSIQWIAQMALLEYFGE